MHGVNIRPGLQQERPVQVLQIILSLAIAADYAISTTIDHVAGAWFYALPASLVLVALLIPVGNRTTGAAKWLLLLIYYFLTAVLLIFTTFIFGPYYQLLILLIFAAVLWHGSWGVVYGLLASYVIIALGVWQQGGVEIALFSQAALYIASLSLLAVIFERVTTTHRRETREHERTSQSYFFERTRLLSLINNMADAVIATDEQGTISLYNGATLGLLDTNESLQGKNLGQFIKLYDDTKQPVNIFAYARENPGPITREDLHFIAEDKSIVDVYLNISPVASAGSSRNNSGYIIVMRDITKQKTLDEQRDEFISVASHELRTPIAIAEANISTAMMPKFADQLSDEGKKLLRQAHDNVVFLSSLVNDLHVLAQAEQGRLNLQAEEIHPGEYLKDLAENYRQQAEEKGLTIELSIDKGVEPITASLDALREVMQNFITNAIKYTQEGKVTLCVSPDTEAEGVVFAVKDSGIGISSSDQKHIFEKFYRSEDYRTRQSGGTGLGLYIIKRIVERLGGRIWFESKLNKGSTFYCAIPKVMPTKSDDEDEEPTDT